MSVFYDEGFDFIVAADGSGTHVSVNDALEDVPDDGERRYRILVCAGVYREVVRVNKPRVSLVGQGREQTVISYDNYNGKIREDGSGTYGTYGSATVFVEADDFYAEGLCFENSFDESSASKNLQAVALANSGDKSVFLSCRFAGHQDTLFAKSGRQFYKNCVVEGDVDFIFGDGPCVFYDCEIKCVVRPGTVAGVEGFIVAPSTPASFAHGFVFINCRLSASPEIGPERFFLGRGWHPSSYKDRIDVSASAVFISCYIGNHIKKEGWTVMNPAFCLETERFGEWGCYGPGAVYKDKKRIRLSDKDAAIYGLENIGSLLGGWRPFCI